MTSLVQISDLHFGAEDPVLVAALEEKIAELQPDALAVAGDLTQKGRSREFEAAADFLSRLPYPKLVAPGNHDTPVFNIFARLTDPFGRHHKRMRGAIHRFRGENLVARTLNTARGAQLRRDWSLGVVDLAHAGAVVADLDVAPADHARVLVCHHPLVTPSASPFEEAGTHRGEAAALLLSESGVDLVLTGHLHVEFAEPLPGGDGLTWAVGSGTALSRRLRGAPAGFNMLSVEGDTIRVQVFHSGGKRFDLAAEHLLQRRQRPRSAA